MELTPRQRTVLQSLHAGKRPAEIAIEMGVAHKTMLKDLSAITSFYETVTYREAIQKAKRRGDL